MKILEHMIFEPRSGMFREFEELTTHFEPKDPSLYRKLLPEPFAMPSRPVPGILVSLRLRFPRSFGAGTPAGNGDRAGQRAARLGFPPVRAPGTGTGMGKPGSLSTAAGGSLVEPAGRD